MIDIEDLLDDLDPKRANERAALIDRLVALGEEGLASGIDESFDADEFIATMRREMNEAGGTDTD